MEHPAAGWFVLLLLGATLAAQEDPPAMTNKDIIETAYASTVEGLYRNLYDKLVTNPPGDEEAATENFKRGVEAARHAKKIALKAMATE